jgi:hypothetical protein
MVVANFDNDVPEYWEWSGQGLFPFDASNEAYKLGVNYIIYGLTLSGAPPAEPLPAVRRLHRRCGLRHAPQPLAVAALKPGHTALALVRTIQHLLDVGAVAVRAGGQRAMDHGHAPFGVAGSWIAVEMGGYTVRVDGGL